MTDKKVRYAVVGLGWISQEVVLPAFSNTTNSELTALVTDDAEKARQLGKQYKVTQTTDYDGYDQLLRSGNIDAVYLGVPNHLHKDYTQRAAAAKVHVLCEKPMAINSAECQEMIDAAYENQVKLMIAYRLHFEPANLAAVELIKEGKLGAPRIFNSVFSQQIAPDNIRLKKSEAEGGGPLMDMGVYPINAARYLFQDEPFEVTAIGTNSSDKRFEKVHEAITGFLHFGGGDRLAVITCSFGAAVADSYQVVGGEGELWLQPAFDYHNQFKLKTVIGGKTEEKSFDKVDQFAAEIEYFSKCILNNEEPEPSGQEGLADIRIVEAFYESIKTGKTVTLAPFEKRERPGKHLRYEKTPAKPGKIVNAAAPSAT